MRGLLFLLLLSPVFGFANSSLTYLNRILSESSMNADKNMERLSSGRELLPDNPANYAIYEKLEAHIRGIGKSVANQADMYQYYRYEESVLSSITESLQHIRELSLRLSGGLLGDFEKGIVRNEMDQYYDQILYELKSARFNTIYLFKDLFNDPKIMLRFKSQEFYQTQRIDKLLKYILKRRVTLGARMNGIKEQIKAQELEKENTAAFQSRGDTDYGSEIAEFRKNRLLMLINILMLKRH